jgi:phosphoglycerate dehydrogenase-like enzyme
MKVLLHGPVAVHGADVLGARLGDRVELIEAGDGAALADALAEAEVLITIAFDHTMTPAPNLRLLHLPVSGLDAIDLAAVPDGCIVCNVFEHATGVSEYAMAAMLDWTIGLAGRSARFKAGDWSESPRTGGATRPELAGKTVGCVGYGSIGQAVAARARAFGMKIHAVTRTPRPLEPEPDWLGGFEDLERLCAEADFIVIACPLTDETKGLIGAKELPAIKPSAVLINVARAHIVDEDALYEALSNGSIAGAALDPCYRYPAPNDADQRPASRPFQDLAKTIMTPHLASWTEGLIARRFQIVADNLERLLAGKPLVNRVYPVDKV